jgi:hypothetical protein
MSEEIPNQPVAAGGRSAKPHFAGAAKLAKRCEQYFTHIAGEWHTEEVTETLKNGTTETTTHTVYDREPEPPTITGLALFLGFESRAALYAAQYPPEQQAVIRRAITRVENAYELALFGSKATSAVFALKNMGWNDKHLADLSGKDAAQANPVVTVITSARPLARSEKDVDV